ncbi:MAG TPA: copper chaperone PCu(A)C, partial [Anaerolineales bacterium]|nr:copper chaperone PCu(A)C [Anaerolineales bacterium]
MKRIVVSVLTMLFLLSACGGEKGMEAHEAWTRPAAQGGNGAVYFAFHNHSSKADELIGASTDVAEAVEIHESSMNGDVMEMKQVKSVPLEAYADIEFEPGGLHVMLINLKKELKIGDEIE